jgi:hypothetical protein
MPASSVRWRATLQQGGAHGSYKICQKSATTNQGKAALRGEAVIAGEAAPGGPLAQHAQHICLEPVWGSHWQFGKLPWKTELVGNPA